MNRLFFVFAAAWLYVHTSQAADLIRDRGLSVHLLPKQTVDEHLGQGLKAGFVVSAPADPRPLFKKPVAQTAKELLAIFHQQPKTVQQNGIWVIVPNDPLYTERDKRLVDELRRACQRDHIPLFVGSVLEIPQGWK